MPQIANLDPGDAGCIGIQIGKTVNMRARQATSRRAWRRTLNGWNGGAWEPSLCRTPPVFEHFSQQWCPAHTKWGDCRLLLLGWFELSGELLCERGQLSGPQCNPSSCFVA